MSVPSDDKTVLALPLANRAVAAEELPYTIEPRAIASKMLSSAGVELIVSVAAVAKRAT